MIFGSKLVTKSWNQNLRIDLNLPISSYCNLQLHWLTRFLDDAITLHQSRWGSAFSLRQPSGMNLFRQGNKEIVVECSFSIIMSSHSSHAPHNSNFNLSSFENSNIFEGDPTFLVVVFLIPRNSCPTNFSCHIPNIRSSSKHGSFPSSRNCDKCMKTENSIFLSWLKGDTIQSGNSEPP